MNHRHHLFSTAPLALAAVICTGVAVLAAAPQDKPPAAGTPAPAAPAQADPQMPPAPGEKHKWLQQLVGNWNVESEMSAPGAPPIKASGTDSVRSIGGRWIVAELKTEIPGMGPMHAVSTIGYDPETGKYQGTWVDSVMDYLWVYTGTLDATGKILTLEAEGPNMMDLTAGPVRFRDVIEIKSEEHRTLSSFCFADGKWVQFGSADYRRTK